MLLNKNENAPDLFYIFIDQYNPMTRHNYEVTKTFTSAAYSFSAINGDFKQKCSEGTATYLPFLPKPPDCLVISPYCLSAINDYRIEYDAEICRYKYFQKYPSRLSAIFAFGEYAACESTSARYGWDLGSVRKFRLIEDKFTRVIRVNMEIVSLARTAYRISTFEESEEILWKAYWNGNGNVAMELPDAKCRRKKYDSGVIWEYLIEGSLVVEE